ncbi:DUF3558 domain-containing protein [Amycolatopsis rhabdoformis]|uniref:DUF3558 domain-containing protein n=1 Tax=Amycolatopsis rhabdoformis TaxID=1448059 RepID=A0ABZ1I1P8_9PSEU|nr:DUF3558 domain-containing protein [Amycolatopsis rhabdoformis]WSE28321.1 DUF3558 domain-containing protein [Amycolatopsis rhabdoformis]
MISRTVRIAAGTVAALAALTACSGGSGGGTSPSSAAPASSPAAGSGPRVPAALPTDALLSDPCSVLTADGATQVGLALPGKKDTGSSQLTGCMWKSTRSDQNSVSIYPLPQNKGGISDIYSQKDQDVYFQPVSIDGYPGVFADVHDGRPSGSCTLWVGVTDQLAVSVISAIGVGDNKNNPCAISQKFGTAMIGQLKGAA